MTLPNIPLVAAPVQEFDRLWVDYEHRDYTAKKERWQYVNDVYTGELLDPEKITDYLLRKKKGEAQENYEERQKLADYHTHMALIVSSLAGMLSHADESANRIWNVSRPDGSLETVLGDPNDHTSIIGRLYRDADGHGTGWKTLHKKLASDLTAYHVMWGLVDPGSDREPRVRYLRPNAVSNWIYGPASPAPDSPVVLSEVLVREEADTRTSLEEDPSAHRAKRYVRYRLDGWQRYERRQDKTGRDALITLDGPGDRGSYHYEDIKGARVLPIFRIVLPLGYDVGYLLARRCVALFNKKSERDNTLRNANFQRLCVVTSDEATFNKIIDSLAKGANTMQEFPGGSGGSGAMGGPHHYIAPDPGPATIATSVLDADTKDIYLSTFREYNDAAKQATATEIKQRVSAGEGAFLQLLSAALDDAETQAAQRVAQQQLPNAGPQKWFAIRVERSGEFLPADPEIALKAASDRAFGKDAPVPMGTAGRLAVAKEVAAYQGVTSPDDTLESEVESRALIEMCTAANKAGVPLPVDLRVYAAMLLAVASGVIDSKTAETALKAAKIDAASMIEQARILAEADDARRELEAQHFGGPAYEASTPKVGAAGPGAPPNPAPPALVTTALGDANGAGTGGKNGGA